MRAAFADTARPRDPTTTIEALSRPDALEWKASILEELENMLRNQVWTFTYCRSGMKPIRTKWALKCKYDEDGKLARYRARLVALGNQQRPGIDYDLTYSPVVKIKTTRMMMVITTELEWEVDHVDIVAAYLTATLTDETYIEIPADCIEMLEELRQKYPNIPSAEDIRTGKWVIKLNRCMYELHQSGRIWNERADAFLKSAGLTRSVSDPCLYYHPEAQLVVTVHVDDNLIYGARREINWIKKKLAQEFEIRDLGRARHVQSIRIEHSASGEIQLDQTTYIEEILHTFKMSDCKPTKTPMVIGLKLNKATDENSLEDKDAAKYRTLVRSVLYLATATRPDLAYCVTYLSQFCSKPSVELRNTC